MSGISCKVWLGNYVFVVTVEKWDRKFIWYMMSRNITKQLDNRHFPKKEVAIGKLRVEIFPVQSMSGAHKWGILELRGIMFALYLVPENTNKELSNIVVSHFGYSSKKKHAT